MRLRLATALAAAVLLAGCGGGGDERGVAARLDAAFGRPITSAVVTADLEIRVKGIAALAGPLRLQVSGPYRSGGRDRIPAFDWEVGFSGGGQAVSGGLLSTGRNVFVNLQGTDYEVGEEAVRRFNRRLAVANAESGGRTLAQLGVDPASWLGNAQDEGGQTIAGVETTHLKADVDVGRMLEGLNRLVDRAGAAVPGRPPPTLGEAQRKQIERVVKDPTIDVYVGKGDGVVRRLAASLELDVPADAQAQLRGLEGGTISFSVEFAAVGRPVRISAPRRARPIAELASQLGGLGALPR